MVRSVVVLMFAVGVSGCLESLPDAKLIEGLRVLGVQAQPPEVGPGGQVSLEALVVDAEGRDITIEWAICLLPERAFGFFADSGSAGFSGGKGYGLADAGDCFELQTIAPAQVFGTGSGPSASFSVPADFYDDLQQAQRYVGLPPDLDLPPEAVIAFLTVAGVNLTASLRVTAGDDTVAAYKRINVSLAGANNSNLNPAELAFHLGRAEDAGGEPKTAAPPGGRKCFVGEDAGPITVERGVYRITPLNIPDPPLQYPVLIGGTSTEEAFGVENNDEVLFYSFFARESGNFDRRVVKSTGRVSVDWLLDDAEMAPGPELPIWIVVRDGRGGLSWCHSVVQLSAP